MSTVLSSLISISLSNVLRHVNQGSRPVCSLCRTTTVKLQRLWCSQIKSSLSVHEYVKQVETHMSPKRLNFDLLCLQVLQQVRLRRSHSGSNVCVFYFSINCRGNNRSCRKMLFGCTVTERKKHRAHTENGTSKLI